MKRSKFNLDYYNLTTLDMGQLIPIGLTEALPGDSIRHHTNCLVRFSPLVRPVMHPIKATLVHFFVPHRLAWDGWEDFITAGPQGNDTTNIPQHAGTGRTDKDLLDYYGVPPVEGVPVSKLPLEGYRLIYNEFFRDQDLIQEAGNDDTNLNTVRYVSWEKDYFSTSRPWEQKGDQVSIPIAQSIPVISDGNNIDYTGGGLSGDSQVVVNAQGQVNVSGGVGNGTPVQFGTSTGLVADAANAEAVPINEWRRAFALQRFAENRARYGSRYAEYLRGAFGVRNRDARIQRPQMLGGGSQILSISEVLKTGEVSEAVDPGGRPLADLAGHGIGMLKSNRYQRFFEEHGYIHTLMYVRPRALYTQGIDRSWLKRDRFDFFQKELAFIGQQPVLLNELYADATNGGNTFGYSDRFREYRENRNKVTSEFRLPSMNAWHLGRSWTSAPTLNADFIECKPSKRIFAEQTQNSLWIMASHKMRARRPVPRSAAGRVI